MELIGRSSFRALTSHYKLTYFEEVNSTNSYAKENFESLSNPHIILTDHHTAGRGRNQKFWQTLKKGDGLYGTWAFKSSVAPDSVLPMRVGLSLYHCLSTSFKLPFSLKAPNDIHINNQKLSGILVEGIHYKNIFYTFIGIGLNVLSVPNLSGTTCLLDHTRLRLEQWQLFVLHLSRDLEKMMHIKNPVLSALERQQLLSALKKHNDFQDAMDITELGDIVFTNRRINWLDL